LAINLINSTQSWWWHDLAKVCGEGAKDNWFGGRIVDFGGWEKSEVLGGYLGW